jgi:hypothetical protein
MEQQFFLHSFAHSFFLLELKIFTVNRAHLVSTQNSLTQVFFFENQKATGTEVRYNKISERVRCCGGSKC